MKITLELDIRDRELSDTLETELLAGRALAWKLSQLKGVHLDLSALHWVLVEAELSSVDEGVWVEVLYLGQAWM